MEMPILLLRKFVRNLGHLPAVDQGNDRIAIYLSSWLGTAVPWYSIVLGLLLRRKGHSVYYVWDDLNVLYHASKDNEAEAIFEALSLLEKAGIPHCRISAMDKSILDDSDLKEAMRLSMLNAIWWDKTPVFNPSLNTRRLDCFKKMLTCLPKILGFFDKIRPTSLVVPGGIFSNSGLFLYACKRRGIRVSTYDSGVCSLSIGINTVAAQLEDIPYVLYRFLEDSEAVKMAKEISATEIEKRLYGKDKYNVQPVESGTTECPEYDVVFPLNIENDASALGKHVIFQDSYCWLNETIEFLLKNTNVSIAVRQHPYENRLCARNNILFDDLIKKYDNSGRFTFIDCGAPVNTYDLLKRSKVVLPFISTIAIEASLMGCNIIPVAPAFYAGFSFAPLPINKHCYFQMIKDTLDGKLQPNPKGIDEAWLAYYFSQVCGRIWTDFTPQPAAYKKWKDLSVEELYQDDNVKAVLRCIGDGEYISMVQHDRVLREGVDKVYAVGRK